MDRGPTAKQTATCFSARTWSLYILVLSYMTVMLDGVNRLGAVRVLFLPSIIASSLFPSAEG